MVFLFGVNVGQTPHTLAIESVWESGLPPLLTVVPRAIGSLEAVYRWHGRNPAWELISLIGCQQLRLCGFLGSASLSLVGRLAGREVITDRLGGGAERLSPPLS